MIIRAEPTARQLDSPLGRLSPLMKLAIAVAWLIGLATTTSVGPPLVVATACFTVGLTIGRVPIKRLATGAAPLLAAALSVGLFNTIFAAANVDPVATEIGRVGPLRLTGEGLAAGLGLASRILAVGVVSVVFVQTTDSTRLVDSLVQLGNVPARFGYGALAAYQAIPRFADDLTTLRQARRIRGLGGSWHPRLLVSLLILAVRHGDRLALAMDARAFGTRPRTWYRVESWTLVDGAAAVCGWIVLAAALALD